MHLSLRARFIGLKLKLRMQFAVWFQLLKKS